VHEGDIYVAAAERLFRIDDVETNLESPKPIVVYGGFPGDRWHGWRYIGFGPDGRLYVAVGAPCKVCEKPAPYGSILRMKPDGSAIEPFALGVRNSVGFDWDPKTGELWFTDNGRDQLGDDLPPDELNHAPRAGMHFGFPYCHGGDLADPEFGEKRACGEFTPPAQKLGPHVAAIGMRFYDGEAFPDDYRGAIFVAEHGSWNRSTPIGYRVTVVRPWETGEKRYRPFAEGWLRDDGRVWGRPADVLVAPDGSLFVSDDGAGAIYRIRYDEAREGG
jgi:glucose/arabinose dehydrogenase